MHPRMQGEIRAIQVRRDIGLGRAEALAVAVRHLVHTDAFLFGAVEVVIAALARLFGGLDEDLAEAVRAAQVHHVQRPAAAVKGVGATFVVFGAFEVGQHVVIRPARIALRGPAVVIASVAACVDHRVDRTRAAEYLAARLVAAPAVQPGLRHGVELPVRLAVLREQRQPRRAMDQHALVGRAGLQQRNAEVRVFAQPAGEHATRRTAADDDVVEHGPRPPKSAAMRRLRRIVAEARARKSMRRTNSRVRTWQRSSRGRVVVATRDQAGDRAALKPRPVP